MNTVIKDILDVLIVPITLFEIGSYLPVWNKNQLEKSFIKLILRELDEMKPFPESKLNEFAWCDHLQKRFIHEKIFMNPSANRDFILSLHPDLAYFKSQLWTAFDKAERTNKNRKMFNIEENS